MDPGRGLSILQRLLVGRFLQSLLQVALGHHHDLQILFLTLSETLLLLCRYLIIYGVHPNHMRFFSLGLLILVVPNVNGWLHTMGKICWYNQQGVFTGHILQEILWFTWGTKEVLICVCVSICHKLKLDPFTHYTSSNSTDLFISEQLSPSHFHRDPCVVFVLSL